MNYINFLRILFCLFLHVSILYPSEKKDKTQRPWMDKHWQNPLTDKETYEDDSGHFTLDYAKKIAKGEERTGGLWFMLHDPLAKHTPLEWTCLNQNPFSQEKRLKIAKFCLEKKICTHTINEALRTCLRNKDRNSEIIKILQRRISPSKDSEQDNSDN